jgi:hypothetical protein
MMSFAYAANQIGDFFKTVACRKGVSRSPHINLFANLFFLHQ